ncbi:hypothetical protein OG394_00835 [Kribbella sp. NBC_01245]|uniref:hypothetical protein n=1 Tax=Kribbella sp. NBC_01245 TaxID=2903578 RepID=UPI002E28D532|nr:hypothetical protein [Kribbella sp. NBC_01245]
MNSPRFAPAGLLLRYGRLRIAFDGGPAPNHRTGWTPGWSPTSAPSCARRSLRVDVVRAVGGGRLYRQPRASGHDHYLVCRYCLLSRTVDAEIVQRWAEHIAVKSGFTDVETPSNSPASAPGAGQPSAKATLRAA